MHLQKMDSLFHVDQQLCFLVGFHLFSVLFTGQGMNNPGAAGFQDIASALTAIASNPGKNITLLGFIRIF